MPNVYANDYGVYDFRLLAREEAIRRGHRGKGREERVEGKGS